MRRHKLISIKVSPDLYNAIVQYAQDTGIENVSTALRVLVIAQLKKEGYSELSHL